MCSASVSGGMAGTPASRIASRSITFRRPVHRQVLVSHASSSKSTTILEDAGTLQLVKWATSVGITTEKVVPASFKGLRGLMAANEIQEDDPIITLPRDAAITLPPRSKFPHTDFCSAEFYSTSPWFTKLAVKLLYEKYHGTTSKFAIYIQQLPVLPDIPVNWDDDQIQQLQYPFLIQQVKEQKQEWARLYQKMRQATPSTPITEPDWFWALSCVRSRTFSGPYIGSSLSDRIRLAALVALLVVLNSAVLGGSLQDGLGAAISVFVFNILYEVILSQRLKQYAMCPFVDLLNHSSSVKSEVSYDYFLDRYSVMASRAYRRGEQVLVTYGAQSNDSLMQFYGFAEPNNPQDGYQMAGLLKWLEQTAPGAQRQERLARLSDGGLLKCLQEVWVQREGFPAATLQALRYLLVDDASAQAPLDSFLSASSTEVERKLAAVLAHACRQELEAMGTTLEDDEKLLAGGKQLSSSLVGAVLFRIEKKKVLRSCLKGLGGS